MGGASDSGLEEKLSMESSPGEPALPGVSRPGGSWLGLSRLGVRLSCVWWLRVRRMGVSWLGVRLTGGVRGCVAMGKDTREELALEGGDDAWKD